MSRFGEISLENINQAVTNNKPINTVRSENYIWAQFTEFCKVRSYILSESTTETDLMKILQDWAFNMRKKDGSEYKERVVKLMWNVTAKLIQKKYFDEYKRSINPFKDSVFEKARKAKDTKRKQLQNIPEKRKISSAALTMTEIKNIASSYDENTPDGLQKKFYHIAAVELAWRGNEAVACEVDFFLKETNNDGFETGRIEYNPIFSKTAQGGNKNLSDSKWLIPNKQNEDLCPVRLFNKIMEKRTANITSRKLFLTPNKYWLLNSVWYKNMPIGINHLSKWTRIGADKIGLDTKEKRFTNHSNRSSTVSNLSKAGANLQEIIKITGHTTISSLEPYLKLNEQHHSRIISSIRKSNDNVPTSSNTTLSENSSNITYNNCTFNFYNK